MNAIERHKQATGCLHGRRYYASMRILRFRVTTGDGLATIVCAFARSATPNRGLLTLRHNSATLCCAPWRCPAITNAQSRSTELNGGLNLITYIKLMKFDTSSQLCIVWAHWLISNDLAHNSFQQNGNDKMYFHMDVDNHDWIILLYYWRPYIYTPDHW